MSAVEMSVGLAQGHAESLRDEVAKYVGQAMLEVQKEIAVDDDPEPFALRRLARLLRHAWNHIDALEGAIECLAKARAASPPSLEH